MSRIFYEVPILDDEGNQFAEFDATVHFSVALEDGEPIVSIDSFDVDATNGKVKSFSSLDEDQTTRILFLRAKDVLEQSQAFIDYTLNASDEVMFMGRGANDPDGHFMKSSVASHSH